MASSRRFALSLAGHVLWLLAAAAASAALLALLDAPTAAALALIAAAAAAVELWRVVNSGNAELTRFVTALERIDLGQSFRREGRGAGFEKLGSAYERALERLRNERASGVATARIAETLVDGAPTPLLVLTADEGGGGGQVAFANKAARRLFGRSDPCRWEALGGFGPPFVAALNAAAPGPTQLTHILLDGLSQRVTLDTTQADIGGRVRRIVALKVIQVELDRAELAAQVDLVRVLTHEVMNSLTPVTSLAATASRLVDGVDPMAAPGIADAQLAITTLARRAAELERFVTSYKGFSEAPLLHRAPIPITAWFDQLAELFAPTPAAGGVTVSWSIDDDTAAINGDIALLTQVMLNLLKNAGEAAMGSADAMIAVAAEPVPGGGRVKITIADSGPGIPPALMRDVFLPFFTTKPAGTGIGLSFARQIVMLHGGQLSIKADGCGLEVFLPRADCHGK